MKALEHGLDTSRGLVRRISCSRAVGSSGADDKNNGYENSCNENKNLKIDSTNINNNDIKRREEKTINNKKRNVKRQAFNGGDRDTALISNDGQSLPSLTIPSAIIPMISPIIPMISPIIPIISSILSPLLPPPASPTPPPSLSSQSLLSPILSSGLIIPSATNAPSSISISTTMPTTTTTSSSTVELTTRTTISPAENGSLPTSLVTSSTTFTENSSESDDSDGKSKLKAGIISGIVLGILVILLFVAYFVYRAIRRRRKGKGIVRLSQDLETTYMPSMTHAIPAHPRQQRPELENNLDSLTKPLSLLGLYKNPSTSSFIEDFNNTAYGASTSGTFNRDAAVGGISSGSGINNSGGFLYGETVANIASPANNSGSGSGLRRSFSAPSSPTSEKVQTVQVGNVPSSLPQIEQQSPLGNPFLESVNPFSDNLEEDELEDEFQDTSEGPEDIGDFPKPPERINDASRPVSLSSKTNNDNA
ncbi:6753_t:CDS:2 [Ambispora gerdemannii]|uniref:6753_t:CDS:1 n=1 Tax=Ambispora gerdemannii TaxID=144530 RepID=A0A9N9DQG7_9GLOM|nr:6753_t:CDS:2 [Ambispora gerdemannii]